MTTLHLITRGFQSAKTHPRLVAAAWLAPLLPALVLVLMAGANFGPVFGHSLFSEGILDGSGFPVFMEFRTSPSDALTPIMGRGLVVMALLSLGVQILLSAGIVGVLAGPGGDHPFLTGIRRNTGRFLRAFLIVLVPAMLTAVPAAVVVRLGGKIAEATANGFWDLAGLAAAAMVFLLLWGPVDLAYDLSRLSAVHHGQTSMVRGFLRSLFFVLRRPRIFLPMFLAFASLPVAVLVLFNLIRQPWTPGGWVGIGILVLLHQGVMLLRAFIKIGCWGAEAAAFSHFDRPRWCRPKRPAPDRPPVAHPLEAEPTGECHVATK